MAAVQQALTSSQEAKCVRKILFPLHLVAGDKYLQNVKA
jgi:hypothetical protein